MLAFLVNLIFISIYGSIAVLCVLLTIKILQATGVINFFISAPSRIKHFFTKNRKEEAKWKQVKYSILKEI